MRIYKSLPLTLIAAAMISGCSTVPNQALTEAHSTYNNARSNPEVTHQAALELKDAGDSLNKADAAFSENEEEATVTHLAYVAKQQVGIAQQTAKRKTAELAVTTSAAKRTQVQLDARTDEADAAKLQIAQLMALNAEKTGRGMVMTLGDVLFSTDRAQLNSGGIRNVQKLADFLVQYPQYKVLIEGYTDSTGSDSHNQALSERRASTVQMALLETGISNDRIQPRGYGESFPVAGNDTAASRQMNRRVEIVFSDENGALSPR